MKSIINISFKIFVAVLVLSSVSKAQFTHVSEDSPEHKIVHTNPLEGLKCCDAKIRFDSAWMLGEFKCSAGCIELMRVLREDPDESVRIVAALSLIKIGNPIGIHLVKRVAQFSESYKFATVLNRFYDSYLAHSVVPNSELTDTQIAALFTN